MESQELLYNHLINCSNLINGDSTIATLIKSHLLTQCVEMSIYRHRLPPQVFGPHVRCSNCCTSWSDQKFTLKRSKKLSKSARKRLKMKIKQYTGSQPSSVVNKAYQKLNDKLMLATCSVCGKKTEINFKRDKTMVKEIQPKIEKYQKNKSNNSITSKQTKSDKSKNKFIKAPIDKIDHKMKNEKRDSFYLSSGVLLKNNESKVKVVETTIKKKRHKDKFAGLCKIAVQSQKVNPIESKSDPKNKALSCFLRKL